MAPTENFYRVIFTPMGNFGPNPDNPSGHLVVKNGNFRKKSPIFDTNIGQIKKTFFLEIIPPGISGCTKLL